ncbi:hypothetical protein LAZ67_X000694 [Cordylochernes scorpioides]|uniref:Transposase n=1 Tax=Cordylochernes scorpioides TaxID=51811 RepID=A0ABY6LWP5_9ARAC|nr:hypothetical protein LAZ67_X000694 [Cordylochernes scorpioides]
MKGRRYATLDEIKTASKEALKKILKNDFLKCFEDWKNRWHKCIISHGDYFEGDKIENSNIIISNFYIHPNNFGNIHQIFIKELLETFGLQPIILCGDFNSRHPVWYNRIINSNGYKFHSIVDEYNLFIHNLKTPTCRNASIIDLTISNKNSIKLIQNWSTSTFTSISDHVAITFDIRYNFKVQRIGQKSTWKFIEKNANWEKFTKEISFQNVFWIVFDFYLLKKMDQRTCIKFCVKNEIKCADAFRMLTVTYGEATLDRSNVYRWYKMFSEGREDVNDEERAGRPSTSTTDEKINELEKMILANRRITVREVAEDLNISIGSCHSIFINDLGMRRVAAKFVPKLLNCDQKQHRMNIDNEMLDSVRDDPNLLQRVITGDEAWVYGYDVETKAQSSQWKLPHEPRPKKARQVRSNVKVLLTVFFDCRGVVHHEFLPQGRTVNKKYYLQVMRNLREAIRQKRPDLWKKKIGFCTTITPLLTHRCLSATFWPKKHTNDAAATVFPRSVPL